MTVRTLVTGVPLPNLAFDNASFLSAPSFSEYGRLFIDPAAASRVIDEVAQGTAVHQTYGGQAIVNGEGSSFAFGLAELLEMRRRETARLLERGGLIVCLGYPDAVHTDITWNRYSWLPEDEGFAPAKHLLPGFGTTGAVLTVEDHPFAAFLRTLDKKIAYRVHVDEEAPAFRQGGRVFARSAGGSGVGFDLPLAGGHLVFLPAIVKPEAIRTQVAEVVAECLEAWDADAAATSAPRLIHKEAS
ncbi:MAG: hypothetical protein DRI30_00980 [Chloroflexi bacterium]|nr:MAG: hypothetical protein DRI30_00980 [Chloroflexota bacterium]